MSSNLVNNYERELLDNFVPELEGVQNTGDGSERKMVLLFEMTSNGLFKIEP